MRESRRSVYCLHWNWDWRLVFCLALEIPLIFGFECFLKKVYFLDATNLNASYFPSSDNSLSTWNLEFLNSWKGQSLVLFFLKFHNQITFEYFHVTLPAPCISGSCIKIKINLNFHLHTSLWYLKRFYESSIVNEVIRGNFKSFLQKDFIGIKRIKSIKSTKSIKTLNKQLSSS